MKDKESIFLMIFVISSLVASLCWGIIIGRGMPVEKPVQESAWTDITSVPPYSTPQPQPIPAPQKQPNPSALPESPPFGWVIAQGKTSGVEWIRPPNGGEWHKYPDGRIELVRPTGGYVSWEPWYAEQYKIWENRADYERKWGLR